MQKYTPRALFDKGPLQALAALFTLAWILVISSRYVSTVIKALWNPSTPGVDKEWMALWIVFNVALFASVVLVRKYKTGAFRLWSMAMLAGCIAISVLSGVWLSAIIGLWVCIVAVLIGDRVLSWFGLDLVEDSCGRVALGLTLGVCAIATATLAVALLKLLTPAVIWTLLVVVTLAEFRHARRLAADVWAEGVRFRRSGPDLEHPVLLLLCGFLFTLSWMWTVTPEGHFDSLNYHLAVPRIYLEEGRLLELPYFFHSYFAHLFDLFITFCMALHDEFVAKTANALFGVAAAMGTYSVGRRVFTPSVGLWAAAFFYATPLTSWLSGTTYSDLAVALFVVALAIAVLRWNEARTSRWIWVAGMLAGGAIAMKLNATYVAIGLGLPLAGLLPWSFEPIGRRLLNLAKFGVASVLMAVPWYGLIYIQTGNPFFPLLNGVFKSSRTALENTLFNAADFGIGTALGALMRLPFMVTFNTTRFGDPMLRGGLGPLLIFFIPLGLAACRRNAAARMLATVTLVYLILWAYTFQYGRYYFAVFPLIALLGVAGAKMVPHAQVPLVNAVSRVALAIMLVMQFAALPGQFWSIPERYPFRVALGMESHESFLKRAVWGYTAAKSINESIQPGERVLGVSTENVRFYLKAPLETLSESLLDSPLRGMIGAPPGPELAHALSELHFSYLLVSRDSVENPDPGYPYVSKQFLEDYASLQYADRNTMVFRLKQQ